jgi:hypothetical protein
MNSIPLDVIHHHIFPLLDHPSRIGLNGILPCHERRKTLLKKEILAEFSALYSRCMVQRLMSSMLVCSQRDFLKTCRAFNRDHIGCLRHFVTFRKKFLRTLTAISQRVNERPRRVDDADPVRWHFVTKYMKKEIMKHIDDFFLAAVEATNSVTPKIRFQEEFTPVGLTHHTVVKMPVFHSIPTAFDTLDDEMEHQLSRGREMMAFWAARGDFSAF